MGGPPSYEPLTLSGTPFAADRPPRDRPWAIALLVAYVATVAAGLYSYHHINPIFFNLTPEYLSDAKNCPIEPSGRRLLQEDPDQPSFDAKDFFNHATCWLAGSIFVSLLIGYAFVHLVRHHAHNLTRATISFQILMPTLLTFSLLFGGNVLGAVGAGVFAALTYYVFYIWRNEISVASKLLSVAGHGLAANTSIFLVTIGLCLASVILSAPLVSTLAFAFADGTVVPNPIRAGSDACVDPSTDMDVFCCSWQPQPRAAASMVLAAFTASWLTLTASQVVVFAVSGTIAQWYFSPPGAPTTGAMKRSLGHALTSSLGTNAFGGLVLTFTNAIKSQNSADQQNGQFSILGFLASCIASIYEFLTKFATVMAAVTGEALLPAGRRVTDLLARNMLTAFATTIWFPSAVLYLASFTLASMWGGVVWLGYRWLHGSAGGGGGGELYPSSNAAFVGIAAAGFSFFILTFVAGVLLSVLDAVFVCFALDRDREAVANAELYTSLLEVAEERGVLVHGPTDEMEYGARETSTNTSEPAYQPPAMRRL